MKFNYDYHPDHERIMSTVRANYIKAGIIDPSGRPPAWEKPLTADQLDRRGFHDAAYARRRAMLEATFGGTFQRVD